jgi:microcin C transport system permease protein
VLFLLIILSSMIVTSFWWILGLMLLFRWMSLVDVVRAEFLRARNFDYVRAARALGLPSSPSSRAMCCPMRWCRCFTFLPFHDHRRHHHPHLARFLGFGLPLGSPSLGRNCWRRAKITRNRPGLG